MKRFFLVFIVAVALNVVWENMHSVLYATYKGGEITEFILIRASLFDGLVITILAVPFLVFPLLKKKSFLIGILGILIGVFNEWYGLSTARWVYNDLMPIFLLFMLVLLLRFNLECSGTWHIRLVGT